jgi:presequence protease
MLLPLVVGLGILQTVIYISHSLSLSPSALLAVMLRVNRSSIWGASRHLAPAQKSVAPYTRRGYASVTDLKNYPQPGEQLHGFTLKRTKHVPELELTALHLEHDKTGANYLHVARDDANNVFSIGFKTNPPDDTGVPHILEHTTLCGSEKYANRPSHRCSNALT